MTIDKWKKEINCLELDIAEILKKRRKELGYNQTKVSNELGFHRSWLSSFENGRAEALKLENIIILCKYYDIKFFDLMETLKRDL
ncbi:helix-turn-helix transcriptional regulator [Staphylococcus warneri]|uniref:helix-turn-helix domain-containing protein n=1 Tax=Staphylococcus warneri TaxID=1292 RepID=UPI003260FC1C